MNELRLEVGRLRQRLKKSVDHWPLISARAHVDPAWLRQFCRGALNDAALDDVLRVAKTLDKREGCMK